MTKVTDGRPPPKKGERGLRRVILGPKLMAWHFCGDDIALLV